MPVHCMKLVCFTVVLIVVGPAGIAAQEKDPLAPRVPSGNISEAKALTSPLKVSESIIAEGKALYETKGSCLNCHGKSGKGDGPVGAVLNPPPRDLTNCAFQKKRSDGELFLDHQTRESRNGNALPGSWGHHRRRSLESHRVCAEFLPVNKQSEKRRDEKR